MTKPPPPPVPEVDVESVVRRICTEEWGREYDFQWDGNAADVRMVRAAVQAGLDARDGEVERLRFLLDSICCNNCLESGARADAAEAEVSQLRARVAELEKERDAYRAGQARVADAAHNIIDENTAASQRMLDRIASLEAQLAACEREADRLRHGVPVDGDFVCPDSLRADAAEAQIACLPEIEAALETIETLTDCDAFGTRERIRNTCRAALSSLRSKRKGEGT